MDCTVECTTQGYPEVRQRNNEMFLKRILTWIISYRISGAEDMSRLK